MRFKHRAGLTRRARHRRFAIILLLIIATAGLLGGIYLLVLVLTPSIPQLYPAQEITVKKLPQPVENRIYIPKIGVNVPFGRDIKALNDGAWHRFPERGDPVKGGNFVVSAHRFAIGLTPGETKRRSPFYHISKLLKGDQILVDFQGKRYGYEITNHSEVKPTQVEIEAPSDEARLTLYTCTLKGEADGREVYLAKPLGEVDQDGNVERT